VLHAVCSSYVWCEESNAQHHGEAGLAGACAGTQVTVVTSAARLLADKPPKIGAHAASWIQQKGGKVSIALHAIACPA
jgi:hypothetical protein